ncbi:hypothetical protein [Sinosporangium siamense]|uniref:hypothetical protein n=1 Tax=Sinosporangium siamense TaxID=1367973 RepID=UPI001951EC8B|nr:hypothetical protein [Sinosporangium siamense]
MTRRRTAAKPKIAEPVTGDVWAEETRAAAEADEVRQTALRGRVQGAREAYGPDRRRIVAPGAPTTESAGSAEVAGSAASTGAAASEEVVRPAAPAPVGKGEVEQERPADEERARSVDRERVNEGIREAERMGREAIGTVADEAAKWLSSLQARATREVGKAVVRGGARGIGQVISDFTGSRRTRPEQSRDVWAEAVAEQHEEEYVCRACPVCRAIAAQRDSGNDVTGHLMAAGGEVMSAMRQIVDVLQRPQPPRKRGGSDRADLG